MRNVARQCLLLLFCGLLGGLVPARAQDPVVLKALHDGLNRSMRRLRLDNLDKPYFIAYRLREITALKVEGTLGSLLTDQPSRSRWLSVEVRVGGYDLDNTNFLSLSGFASAGVARGFGNTVQLPLDAGYKEIRRQIWLATDGAYKKALQDLARKKAVLQSQNREDNLPDFNHEPVVESLAKPLPVELDRQSAEALVRRLSAAFRDLPEVYSSSVAVHASYEYTYYLNSEGTEFTRATPFVGLTARAHTQAVDGMPLSDTVTAYGRSVRGLDAASLEAQVRQMARRLVELRSAPRAQLYNGPILFEGQASAEIFAQVFAPWLVASRSPVTANPQFDAVFSRLQSPLQDRVGGRVLPDWASVRDDPTVAQYQGKVLLGGYAVDDEGVRASRTLLVDAGVLKTLLRSRDPVRSMSGSTGNARGFGVAPTNLIFTVKGGLGEAALKQKLLSLVRERGKPYGILVRRVQNPLLGGSRQALQSLMGSMLGGGAGLEPPAVLAYKVFPDGREELIRNAQIGGLDAASFRELAGASAADNVYNKLFVNFGNMVTRMLAGGALPDEGNPPIVSLAVPDLLFEDASIRPPSGSIPKLPLSPPPPAR